MTAAENPFPKYGCPVRMNGPERDQLYTSMAGRVRLSNLEPAERRMPWRRRRFPC